MRSQPRKSTLYSSNAVFSIGKKLSAAAEKASDVYGQLSSIAVENRAPLTINLWHGFDDEDAAGLVQVTEEFNATVGQENHILVKLTGYESVDAVEAAVDKAIEEEETKTDDLRRTVAKSQSKKSKFPNSRKSPLIIPDGSVVFVYKNSSSQ